MGLETELVTSSKTYFQLARFLIALVVGVALTRLALMPFTRKLLRRKGDRKALHSIENLVGVVGLFLTFTVALQVGDFGSLASIIGAIAAALTVAIGFGMRDQVSSLVGGIFIHLDNPFIKGDYIKAGEYEGVVKEIKLRATVLNGVSSGKLVVPNSVLTTNAVKNYTRGRNTKTSLEISPTTVDYEKHAELLKQAANDQSDVRTNPEPKVVLKGLEDDKVNAELHYWIRDSSDLKDIRSQVLESYIEKGVDEGLIKEKEESEHKEN